MPELIGLCGGSSSGKTTISNYLTPLLNNASQISMDNYFIVNIKKETETREEYLRNHNFDTLESFNIDLFIDHLKKLKKGIPIEMPIYDYSQSIYVGTKTIYPGKFILVDGILLFTTQKLRNCFDLMIFVECNKNIRYSRRLKRDVVERGADVDLIKHQLDLFVMPMHDVLIEPNKIFSHLIFDNSDSKNENNFKKEIQKLYNSIIRKFKEILLLRGNLKKAEELC